MPDDGLICWSCGQPTGYVDRIARSDQCPACHSDLKTCRGCRHFDPSRRYQCREMIDAPVDNKDKANHCDWFLPRQAMKGPGGRQELTQDKDVRKKRFDDLFKD